MPSLSPEALEAFIQLSRFLVIPLTPGGIETIVPNDSIVDLAGPLQPIGLTQFARASRQAMHGAEPFALHSLTDSLTLVPLSATPEYIQDLAHAAQLPPWVGYVCKMTGLIILVLGVIGWFTSRSEQNRQRGFQMVSAGFILAIIGIGFDAFQNLLNYVLTG